MYKRVYPGYREIQCLICHQASKTLENLYLYFHNYPLCSYCLSKFHILFESSRVDQCDVLILYEYNQFFRELLFRYKASYDKDLANVFLIPFIDLLKRKYIGYTVIPVPSSEQANQKRGFKPMLEIAKTLELDMNDCLYKIDEYKQSNQHYQNRVEVKNHIGIKEVDLTNQKILLIDDVATSFHTVQCCIDLIASKSPKKIKVLLLSKRIRKDRKDERNYKMVFTRKRLWIY